jgi:hypothetical protein
MENFAEQMFPGLDTKRLDVTAYTGYGNIKGYNVSFRGPAVRKNGTEIGRISRSYDEDSKSASHGYLKIYDSLAGEGDVPRILRGQIDSYKKMGLENVQVSASLEAGGYAWAKYGFVPDRMSWQHLQRLTKVTLNNLDNAIDPGVMEIARNIANDSDPKSIWRLSDLTAKVSGYGNQTLGQVLLAGRRWDGNLKLKDTDAMERFDRYVEKSRTRGEAKRREREFVGPKEAYGPKKPKGPTD